MDAIGRDGRQATLPRESSTHEEASDRSQGSWRIPRVINQSKMISSSGDSVAPVMAFISWLLASKCRNTSFSCAERNLLFVRSTLTKRMVGMTGKQTNMTRPRLMLTTQLPPLGNNLYAALPVAWCTRTTSPGIHITPSTVIVLYNAVFPACPIIVWLV